MDHEENRGQIRNTPYPETLKEEITWERQAQVKEKL
jgi:hypothetical protein